MHSTLMELAQCLLCTVAFAVFLVPPGYLVARLLNIEGLRQRSVAEQFLWSIALSIPVALVLAELLGRVLSHDGVLLIFVAMAVAEVLLQVRDARRESTHHESRLETRWAIAIAGLLGAYLILTLIDIQVGDQLWVPTSVTDWAVRVPLVAAAIHGGIPPHNPMSAVGAAGSQPLRYYYFWYVLCAQPARILHIPPACALIASAVWAGFAVLAVLFLALKYLVGEKDQLHRRCLLTAFMPLVIGLDLLPTLLLFLAHGSHPELDVEWWRHDRTPGMITTLVYAPHHAAGLVCCFVAFLVLLSVGGEAVPLTQLVLAAVVAGTAWAACVGTSTFVAFIFVIIGMLWAVDLFLTRKFRLLGTAAGSGVVAWLLSRPFLHEMRGGSSAAQGFATFAWRSSEHIQAEFRRHHIFQTHPVLDFFARQPLILTLDFFELGFFAFVAWYQLQRELLPALRGTITLTRGQRALWAIFIGSSLAALFVSSAVTSSGNDLGGHAGMIVRFVLILWSSPYLEELWSLRGRILTLPPMRRLTTVAAVLCLAIGLAGGLTDALMHRVYIPLFDAGLVKRPAVTLVPDHLGERFLVIRSTWRALDTILPADARVQTNPYGDMQQAEMRYANRQIVASDTGCGTAFGGDYEACKPVVEELRKLYATSEIVTSEDGTLHYGKAAGVSTEADFDAACRDLKLTALVVDSRDHVWNQPASWVWTVKPAVIGPSARAYLCPGAAPSHPVNLPIVVQ